MPLDDKARETLAAVTTATITTILLKKGLRNVWMRGTLPLRANQARIVGPAFTLRFVPAREDLATPDAQPAIAVAALESDSQQIASLIDASEPSDLSEERALEQQPLKIITTDSKTTQKAARATS